LSASASRAPGLSALLFDFGGTLDADGVAWKERFFLAWRREIGDVPRERFDPAFHSADDALVGAVDPRLTLTETAERLARGVAFRLAVGEGSPAARVASRFSREALETLRSRGELLARLARRYRLGIVSNFYGNLAAACEEAGIERHFSALIDSTDVGCSKPDAAIFQAALRKLGTRPEETLLVGDSVERDMAGARALGLPHVLLRARAPGAVHDGTDASPFLCCPQDRSIERLEDLEGALP
jgi:HAD superfamily hydrolase (TIGR01509 family)